MAKTSVFDRIKSKAGNSVSYANTGFNYSSAADRIRARATGIGGYSYYSLNQAQKDYGNAYKTVSDYASRINGGEWLSQDDLAAYKNAIDSYTKTSAMLRNASKASGQKYTADEDKAWETALSSLASDYTTMSDIFSKYKNNDEYQAAKKAQADREEMLKYDLGRAETELTGLNNMANIKNSIANLEKRIGVLKQVKSDPYGNYAKELKEKQQELESEKVKWAHVMEYYGSEEALKAALSEKTAYYNNAKRLQEGVKLGGVSNPESEVYDPNFSSLSSLGTNISWSNTGSSSIKNTLTVYDDLKAATLAMNEKLQGKELFNESLMTSDKSGLAGYWESLTKGSEYNTENESLVNIYREMNDLEAKTLAYYLEKDRQNGTNQASEYVNSLKESLNARLGEKIASTKNTDALKYLFAIEAGLDQYIQGRDALFSGEDYIPTSATQFASGYVRESLDETGIPAWYNVNDKKWENKVFGSSTGQLFYDALNTSANMLPSTLASVAVNYVAPGAGSTVGLGLLGASAAGNAKAEMLRLGYTKEQANTYGILAGASEIALEKLLGGIPGLSDGDGIFSSLATKIFGKVDNAIARGAIALGSNALDEGLEEGLQTVIEPWLKEVVTNVDWDSPTVDEVLYSSLLGALSSVGFTAGSMTANNVSANAEAKNTYGGQQTELVNQAVNSDFSNVSTLGAKLQKKLDNGKNLSGGDINRLLEISDRATIQSAVSERLTELGEQGNVTRLASALAKQIMGEELSTSEQATISKSKNGYLVLTEADPENIRGGGLANKWAESIGTKRVNADVYNLREATEAPKTEGATEAKILASRERVSPAIVTKNAEGKTVKSEISGIEVDGDKATFTLANGEKVNADKATFQTDTQKLVADIAVEKVSRVEGFSTEAATAMVKGYDGKMDVSDYNAAINDAYRYGYQGISINEISLGKNTSLVADKAPLYVAYDAGKQYAKSNFTRPTFLGTKKATAIGSVTVAKSIDQTKLNKAQKTQLKALDVVAAGLGVNINVYDSNVNAEGQRIGENGRYHVETRTIDVDLHSGAKGEGLMLNTAAHEITHHVKNVAADKFKAFADAVFEEFGNRGQQVDALVEDRVQKMRGQKKYAEFTEAQLYDRAYEEVVADAAESMLTDSDALVKLANKIKAKDHSLWESVKNFINKLVKDIKRIYKDLSPNSFEGAFMRDMGDAAERLQKLWVEGVMAASEVDLTETVSEETMVGIDAGSESVSPVMLSERTWTASEYVTAREEMAKKIANALGVSVNKAKKYIDDVNSIAKLIANDRARLDYEASSFGSAFVSNVEYGGSFDYTTLCKKRRIYTGTFTEIQKKLRNTALTPDDILKIRNLLIDEGIEATCGLCYVEGSRANMGKFSQKFIELYKRDYPDAWIPDMADVNTPDGVEKMRIKHPEVYERYEYFWNHYGKLQDSDPALFASQQKPKLYEARKEYKGEILTQFKKDSSIEKKNLNGGIRMQSFSDFEIVHLIDTMQVIMDMSTVGLAGQAYTKVPEFAKAFGNTGLKINLSLIAKGVDADGRLIFDDREGMPHETAFELRNQYSKNVGTIIVTFTDEQLMAAMADERIDFIIPFHRSQWKKGQYGAMGLPKGTKDYTFMQNEKLIRQTYHEYQGRLVKDKATNYMPNEYWDFSKSGKENAEAYLKMCAENNKRPKFYKLLDHDGDGTYSLKADGSTDGYWKLLVDFKMYDNNGVGSPQAQVVPNFNMEESYKMLKEYEGGHAQYPVAQGVVDKFVSEYGKADNVEKTPFSDNLIYQDRLSPEDAFSNRALLASALESVATNEAEREKLKQYKDRVDMLNRESLKLSKINEEIKELTFGKGEKNPARLKELKEEAIKTSNRINLHDKKLLSLEATKSLKDVLDREKKKAYKAAAEKGREALHRNVEGRHKSEARAKIKKLKQKFQSIIEHPTDRQYIPVDLMSAMIDVCDLIDTSSPLYKADGSINKAQQARNEQNQRLLKLKAEYDKLAKSADYAIAYEYEQEIADYIQTIMTDYANKNIADMTLAELTDLYQTMRSIEETLRDARRLIGWSDAMTVYEAGDSIIEEQTKIGEKRKQNGISKVDDSIVNLSLSPVRAVLRMAGYNEDSALYHSIREIENGTRQQKKFVMDAVKKFEGLTTGKNASTYEKAIYDPYGKELIDKNGQKFHVTKMQMMQAIMSYEREMANEKLHHVSNGGFTFADIKLLGKGEIREAVSAKYAHTITLGSDVAVKFMSELANDKWTQEYMAEARRFFDETAKEAINEANMKLKHRIVATGKNYIPYEVNSDFIVREINSENDIQQVISGYGMLKDLKEGASQPLIITGLNNVLDRHIEQVGNVAALAVPIRNFNKIWNVKSTDGSTTVREKIKSNWGVGGEDLITQAVKDVQGPRKKNGSKLYKSIKSNLIGSTFLGNVSVVLKQIGSMYTATSMLNYRDPASMMANLIATKANRDAIAAEVNKYTAVAWVRGQGLSDAEVYDLKTSRKKSKLGRAVDKLPPALNAAKWITQMDYDVALSLWKYAKEDTAKRTGLKGEELLKATADYYNDVIENTQSMSDALHRPEVQKKEELLYELVGMFKTDLYQNAGLLRVALESRNAKPSKETNRALVKAVCGTLSSMCWASLITSVMAAFRYKVDRYRDEEDDEITLDNWLKVVGGDMLEEMVGYMFPLFGSEAAGLLKAWVTGETYEFDNLSLEALNDFSKAMTSLGKLISEGEDDPEKRLRVIKNVLVKATSVFGVPANNVTRFFDAMRLHAQDIANGEFLSFEAGLTSPNNTRLYRAYIEGDADKINKASRLYKDEAALKAGLRKGLRENDPRLREAAIAKLNGDNATYKRLCNEVLAEGKFDRTIIIDAFAAEYNYQKNKADEEGK